MGWLAELTGPRVSVVAAGVLSMCGVCLAVLVTRMVAARVAAREESAREQIVRGAAAAA
ncbi:hypothetical protein GCM10027612_85240 [Microbispora bryophytorum subsp. camponoti]